MYTVQLRVGRAIGVWTTVGWGRAWVKMCIRVHYWLSVTTI